MSPNDADRMANSVDPDQTAPLGAVWSGSALFAQAYLSENYGSLRYMYYMHFLFAWLIDWLNVPLTWSLWSFWDVAFEFDNLCEFHLTCDECHQALYSETLFQLQ